MIIKLPKDKLTSEEVQVLQLFCSKNVRVGLASDIYSLFKDPKDKFIISHVFELKKTYQDTARALGVHRLTIINRIKKIKHRLKKYMDVKHLSNFDVTLNL